MKLPTLCGGDVAAFVIVGNCVKPKPKSNECYMLLEIVIQFIAASL